MSRTAGSAVLAAGLLAVVANALLVSGAVAQERLGDPAKWNIYWKQMMTVITHPRCINCHGATDFRSGDNHGGGALDGEEEYSCIGCHTENTVLVPGRCEFVAGGGSIIHLPNGSAESGWCVPGVDQGEVRLPVGDFWHREGPDFTVESASGNSRVPKEARQLCLEIKERMGPRQLLDHLQNDGQIGFAFEGKRAFDATSRYASTRAEAPLMDRDAFVVLARRWITEAAMACGTDGTVSLDDTVKLDSQTPFSKGKTRNETTAQIRIEDDVASSELHYAEASNAKISTMLPGCPAKEGVEAHFKADGRPATSYEINILPNKTYRMRFILGPVEGQTVWSYKEQLCRPGTRGRERLPTESTIPLRFGVEGQVLEENEMHELILKGSATIPGNMSAGPMVGSSEQKITWDLVIK